ncbi:MAG: hypothetical protein ACE5F6_19615, partial [Anaerolineae bacterium]
GPLALPQSQALAASDTTTGINRSTYAISPSQVATHTAYLPLILNDYIEHPRFSGPPQPQATTSEVSASLRRYRKTLNLPPLNDVVM